MIFYTVSVYLARCHLLIWSCNHLHGHSHLWCSKSRIWDLSHQLSPAERRYQKPQTALSWVELTSFNYYLQALYLSLSHLKNLPGEKQTSLKMFWGYISCVQLQLSLSSLNTNTCSWLYFVCKTKTLNQMHLCYCLV